MKKKLYEFNQNFEKKNIQFFFFAVNLFVIEKKIRLYLSQIERHERKNPKIIY